MAKFQTTLLPLRPVAAMTPNSAPRLPRTNVRVPAPKPKQPGEGKLVLLGFGAAILLLALLFVFTKQ